ncbi:MAG: 2-amino-4-hydroxy-6-hydroxymethyldihydropteridine diphosphokinase [Vicinamibacterales bacterium]
MAVALGSNLGDRAGHLAWALDQLAAVLDGLQSTPPEDTTPLDVPAPQPSYLNSVAIGWTTLGRREFFDRLNALERARGRTGKGTRGARTLDLDLILYGDDVVSEPDLAVPHPRFRERAFVLGPLARLAPGWRDPVSGRTMAALWRARRPSGGA